MTEHERHTRRAIFDAEALALEERIARQAREKLLRSLQPAVAVSARDFLLFGSGFVFGALAMLLVVVVGRWIT